MTPRKTILAQMQNLIYDEAPYDVLYYDANLDAYRTDRFAGWQNMPSNGTPLFTYGTLDYTHADRRDGGGQRRRRAPSRPPRARRPAPAGPSPSAAPAPSPTSSGGDNTALIVVVVLVIVVVIGGWFVLSRRRAGASAEDE